MIKKKNAPKSPKFLKVCQDRDYDCVYLGGQKINLGRTGTPEADAALRQLQIQVLTDPTLTFLRPQQISVDDLCFAYLRYAKENDPTHYSSIKTAVEILLKNFTGQLVESLNGQSFLLLQAGFVQHGVCRGYCNELMGYIRAMLKWGVLYDLVSLKVNEVAKLVPPLRKGKTTARENPKRQDVPDEVVNRTLPHLHTTIRDMVQVQRLAGMRPSEICRMKPGEIDMEYTTPDGMIIWMYTPGTNKNSWREKKQAGEYVRIIPLGKPEQEIIATRLTNKSDDDFVFSPKDTMQEKLAQDAAKRKSKVQPSQVKRKERNAKNPRRKDRDFYESDSYRRAITRAITAANRHLPDGERIPMWTPYQLRHAAITDITLQTGNPDIARAFAGQKSLAVTMDYNHADVQIAINQAVKRSQ